jgi:hypothetical protein
MGLNDGDSGSDRAEELRQEVARGLLYAHGRLTSNTAKTLESSSFLYALVEVLSEKGLITIDELDARKVLVAERLQRQFREQGMGALFQDPEQDKYTYDKPAVVDCENRVHLCHATCCRLPFALSHQDVREGIVHWDLGQPYLIDQGPDGYCTHLQGDPANHGACHCTIYANRPLPCRAYDCRNDDRIWVDFEKGIVNPLIERADWPHCLAEAEARPQGAAPGEAA